jgi:hypothetical protein
MLDGSFTFAHHSSSFPPLGTELSGVAVGNSEVGSPIADGRGSARVGGDDCGVGVIGRCDTVAGSTLRHSTGQVAT